MKLPIFKVQHEQAIPLHMYVLFIVIYFLEERITIVMFTSIISVHTSNIDKTSWCIQPTGGVKKAPSRKYHAAAFVGIIYKI